MEEDFIESEFVIKYDYSDLKNKALLVKSKVNLNNDCLKLNKENLQEIMGVKK